MQDAIVPIGTRLYVSAVSLWPHSASFKGAVGLNRLAQLLEWAGFAGLQGLPLRGYAQAVEGFTDLRCVSLEGVWTEGKVGDFAEVWQGFLDGRQNGEPSFVDYLLFGTRQMSEAGSLFLNEQFPDALKITHRWKPNTFDGILEVVEGTGFDFDSIVKGCSGTLPDMGLCWDTHHSVRLFGHKWQRAFFKLLHKIQIVHLHPTWDQVLKILLGLECPKFRRQVECVLKYLPSDCPIVLECIPLALPLDLQIWALAQIREYLERIAYSLRKNVPIRRTYLQPSGVSG